MVLGKREVVSRCLPPGIFLWRHHIQRRCPSSSVLLLPWFRDVGFAYTGEDSVVHHTLCFHRGTTCRWRSGQLEGKGFSRCMPPIRGVLRCMPPSPSPCPPSPPPGEFLQPKETQNIKKKKITTKFSLN